VNTKTKDSFIYSLENKGIFSGVSGGGAAKFGIYRTQTSGYCKGLGEWG